MASVLVNLSDGTQVEQSGVDFTFYPSLPDLAASTSSEPAGFFWRWLLHGQILHRGPSGLEPVEGGLLVGTHVGCVHALALPSAGVAFVYQAGGVDSVVAELRDVPVVTGMFRRKRMEPGVVLQVSSDLAVLAFQADELDSTGGLLRQGVEIQFMQSLSSALAG